MYYSVASLLGGVKLGEGPRSANVSETENGQEMLGLPGLRWNHKLGLSKETTGMATPWLREGFTVVRENIQRHLEESRTERKRSTLNITRAICKRSENDMC